MKTMQRLIAAFAILLLISYEFQIFTVKAEESNATPMFNARIENSFEGYRVIGTFTEFSSDIILVQTLCSLDRVNYAVCGENWDLHWLGDESEGARKKLQNQICLYSNQEPLKSYLAKTSDCFYLKLRLTKKDGSVYETQTAVIDRGVPQPAPDGLTPSAKFASNVLVRETRPFRYYGQYQLTVCEDATPEAVSTFLPDALPVEIQFSREDLSCAASGVVYCPVAWKPLSFSQLTAGQSMTFPDAAKEIVVPSGTLVNTPLGIFQLKEPLYMDQEILTDEVRLILNVIAKGEAPTGALTAENNGLEMAFQLKPTGVSSIHAYAISEDRAEWEELPALPLQDVINAQPSTANSGYTLVLNNDQEPYRSYLAAKAAGNEPKPFFVGLKIKGGVYDGQQLILAWPDTYDIPPDLPEVGGSGGNEGNAGADNKEDSTEEGQRPTLPHPPKDWPRDELENTAETPGKTEHRPDILTGLPEETKNQAKPLAANTGPNILTEITAPDVSGTGIMASVPLFFTDRKKSADTEEKTDGKKTNGIQEEVSRKNTDGTQEEISGRKTDGTQEEISKRKTDDTQEEISGRKTDGTQEEASGKNTDDAQEEDGRRTETNTRRSFLPAPAAIACIAILAVCAAALSGKQTNGRSGRTSKKR